jgi:UDP-glucose 4-epimerase
MENKHILLFGGSGSLGNEFIRKLVAQNTITKYSRDECKHWQMSLQYKTANLKFIIGDIRDYNSVENAILREQPHIIIIMAALKHIDRCEYAINECLKTNCLGPMNVLNAVEKNNDRLTRLECTVMVSTDKACEPTNVYGMAKALAESAIVEKALHVSNRKFVNIRYGNVLNSRGSIIPLLHEKGQDPAVTEFTLTHPEMTRFVMTLEQSVELIEYAVENGESGDIVIPKLISMRLQDLMDIFAAKYGKPVRITGLRPGEKMLESLISETQAMRLVKTDAGYMHIKPAHKWLNNGEDPRNYNSKTNPLTREELVNYLSELRLI